MRFVKTKTITISLALIASLIFPILSATNIGALSKYCVSDKCKQAAAEEKEAAAKAAEAKENADTLAGEVEKLNNEIYALEKQIDANQAEAADLREQIKENEEKLNIQQNALADMLVEIHFDEQPEALVILAGSSSISDYAEKQSRLETVKTQINLSATAIKTLKEELQAQKKEVDRIIATEKKQRSEITNKRNRISALEDAYRDNAAAYTSDAKKAREIQAQEIAAEIAKYNRSGIIVDSGINSYPYKSRCPGGNLTFSAYGGYGCQCTSYAGWKAHERWGVTISAWGNAKYWASTAKMLGYKVTSTPEIHTVAVNPLGVYGHVMWVEGVNADGTINISEYNYVYANYSMRVNVSTAGLKFIHFD